MALPEIKAYSLDPESENEFEVDEEPQRLLQGDTATDQTTWEEDQEEEEGGDKSSDEDWNPPTAIECDKHLKSSSDGDSDEGKELSDSENTSREPKKGQRCKDCGALHYSKNHICEYKAKPYACEVCGKRCVSEGSLKLHSIIHSETYEHYCKYCYFSCKSKTDKLDHEKTHRNQSKPYKCPVCEMKFASLKDRRKHMKSHKGPDEFMCEFCGLTFGKKHRPRHMLTHTGAKPYECPICERTFNQSGNLKSHIRLHTGEKPYKCKYCDKAFNHNVSLKSHVQRYHTEEPGSSLNKIYDYLAEIHQGTEGDSGDNEQKWDTVQTQKSKGTKNCRTANSSMTVEYSKSSFEENSYDNYDYLSDFQPELMEKDEGSVKQKYTGSKSDSDYDPNEEECYSTSSRKRGRPRKV